MTVNRAYTGASVPVGNPLEPAPSATAELGTGWPKWLFHVQAVVLGVSLGHILAVTW